MQSVFVAWYIFPGTQSAEVADASDGQGLSDHVWTVRGNVGASDGIRDMPSSDHNFGFKRTMLYAGVFVVLVIVSNTTGINTGALIAVGAAVVLILSALITGFKDWKQRRWQFGIRSLLITITVVGIVLGLFVALR